MPVSYPSLTRSATQVFHDFMPQLGFTKYQGLGNDFLIVDGRATGVHVTPEAAVRLTDRRRGVGGDGVITLLPPRAGGDVRMHIYNSDGSVPEMCGNGLRCVVHLLAQDGGRASTLVETDAGPRRGVVLTPDQVEVELGKAKIIADSLEVDAGARREACAISMGNPHLVLRPFDASADLHELAKRWGATLERHAAFPHRTNVEFASVASTKLVRLVVFERGAGITDACGTGAAATVVAMKLWGLVEKEGPVLVTLPGGALQVLVREGEVTITGPAVPVFKGEVELNTNDFTTLH